MKITSIKYQPCSKTNFKLECKPGPHANLCVYCNKDVKEACPPHDWSKDGEKCCKCGTKDWMT